MKRPANEAKVLERLRGWRAIAPTSRSARPSSSAFPARPRRISQYLLDWLDEAQLDRVGAFRFEPVEGAAANDLPGPVPEAVKEERYARHHGEDRRDLAPPSSQRQDRPHARRDHRRGRRADEDGESAPPAAPRPTRPRSTARSICATPGISSRRHRRVPDRGCRRARSVRGDRRRALKRLPSPQLRVTQLARRYSHLRKNSVSSIQILPFRHPLPKLRWAGPLDRPFFFVPGWRPSALSSDARRSRCRRAERCGEEGA